MKVKEIVSEISLGRSLKNIARAAYGAAGGTLPRITDEHLKYIREKQLANVTAKKYIEDLTSRGIMKNGKLVDPSQKDAIEEYLKKEALRFYGVAFQSEISKNEFDNYINSLSLNIITNNTIKNFFDQVNDKYISMYDQVRRITGATVNQQLDKLADAINRIPDSITVTTPTGTTTPVPNANPRASIKGYILGLAQGGLFRTGKPISVSLPYIREWQSMSTTTSGLPAIDEIKIYDTILDTLESEIVSKNFVPRDLRELATKI